MPIKVRCTSCEKVINAPDQARGKAVRCPACKTPIRIPAGAPQRAKTPSAGVGDVEDFLKHVDVSRVEHQSERVCPKCAARVQPEDIDCPECGVNIETGVMSADQRRVRERIGPDPALFYSKAWSNSWAFLKKNKMLAFRTAMYWTLLVWNANFFGGLTIQAMRREEVSLPGKVVETGIWGAVAILSLIGTFGWYWYLTVRVTQTTLEKKAIVKDIHFDTHQCMALGVKAIVWPLVLMMPLLLLCVPLLLVFAVLGTMTLGPAMLLPVGIAFGGLAIFPYLSFPIAMSHMAMPYTYKAWLPTEMVQILFRNIGPVLYWWLMVVALCWPLVGYLFLLDYLSYHYLEDVLAALSTAALWCSQIIESNPQTDYFSYHLFHIPLLILTLMAVISSFTIPAAFPAVFLARANALLTYYRSQSLDLVVHAKEGELAGFWIRYLGFLIDRFILFVINALISAVTLTGILLVAFMFGAGIAFGASDNILILLIALGFTVKLIFFFVLDGMVFLAYRYYHKMESGIEQGTFGKSSLGLLVTDMEGNRVTPQVAKKRAFIRLAPMFLLWLVSVAAIFIDAILPLYGLLWMICVGLDFVLVAVNGLMVAMSPTKQALHDSMTNSKVVWQGESD